MSLISAEVMKAHRATWWVNTGDRDPDAPCGMERLRRTAMMAGFWPGYVVTCSCGEDSRTDSQIEPRAKDWLFDHRWAAQCEKEA